MTVGDEANETQEIYASIIVSDGDTAHEDSWPAIILVRGTREEIDAIEREIAAGGRWVQVWPHADSASEFRSRYSYLFPTPEQAERVAQDRAEQAQRIRDEYQANIRRAAEQREDLIAKYGNKTIEDLKAMRPEDRDDEA